MYSRYLQSIYPAALSHSRSHSLPSSLRIPFLPLLDLLILLTLTTLPLTPQNHHLLQSLKHPRANRAIGALELNAQVAVGIDGAGVVGAEG